jgi:hypothetical protein
MSGATASAHPAPFDTLLVAVECLRRHKWQLIHSVHIEAEYCELAGDRPLFQQVRMAFSAAVNHYRREARAACPELTAQIEPDIRAVEKAAHAFVSWEVPFGQNISKEAAKRFDNLWDALAHALSVLKSYDAYLVKPPEAESQSVSEIPNEYRVGGVAKGRPLTTNECKRTYGICGSALSKLPKSHPARATRIKHGRAWVYRFDAILAMQEKARRGAA